jgi:Icc-related predicted phosphoesterase
MKILALSDKIISFIYSPQVKQRFKDVDLIIGCGDLAYYYLEYVFTVLGVPLFYVRGNHDAVVEYGTGEQRTEPHGGIDLHGRLCCYNGLLMAGVEGSVRYRPGSFQYSQSQMWNHVLSMVPGLLINRLRYGRFLDVFVSHAPPAGIHDCQDLTHQGIRAFRWVISTFQPDYFLHGHIHLHRPDETTETQLGGTRVINTYGFRELIVDLESKSPASCR